MDFVIFTLKHDYPFMNNLFVVPTTVSRMPKQLYGCRRSIITEATIQCTRLWRRGSDI